MSLAICRSHAALLAGGLLLGAFALTAGVPASAQHSSDSVWISLGAHSAGDMTAVDSTQVAAERGAINEQAAFFGYDLSLSGWQYTQAVCPSIPSYLILHYRRTARNGAESLFTALVPRQPGRVQVVPVLYRNATPFKSAVGGERSLSVFNRAVPAEVAEKELQSGGAWLQLAICYAEIVGAEPRVLRETNATPGLVRAPAPTMLISEETHSASVTFTDRNAAHRYTVWDVAFDGRGRAVAASATPVGDYVAPAVNGRMPAEKPLPAQAEPKVIPLPPASPPKTEPLPQR